MTDTLPPLPPADVWTRYADHGPIGAFTADQVRAYAIAVRDAAVAAERAELASDAANFGNALNKAGWAFCDAYQKHTGQPQPTILFNHSKAILRDTFAVYFAALAGARATAPT